MLCSLLTVAAQAEDFGLEAQMEPPTARAVTLPGMISSEPVEYAEAQPEAVRNNEIAFQIASFLCQTGDRWPNNYAAAYSSSDKMRKSGALIGVAGAKTWLFYEPIHAWSDVSQRASMPNIVKIQGEFSQGNMDYDSYVTGKMKSFDVKELDLRLLAGYAIALNDRTLVTPYVGIGYRLSSNNAGGYVDYFVYDYAKFTVKNNLYYLPVGVETLTRLNAQWDVGLNLEADWVIGGDVDYYLNEIDGLFPMVDVNTGEALQVQTRKASSHLNGGFGFRTSVKLIRKFDKINFFVEPYLKFWSLNKSKPTEAHAYAVNNGKDYVSVYPDKNIYKPLWEADTYTIYTGLRMGVQF